MEWNPCHPIVPGLKEAMILAVNNHDWSTVREYIENMAPIDSLEYTQLQQIPIHENIIRGSCSRGFTELVSIFLNNGFPVDYAVDERNETMLQLAASEGCLPLVKLLLKSGANINSISICGKSLLYSAVQKGDLDAVNCILFAGADVNARSKYGETVLHLAAWHENLPIMQLLIENGADINIPNFNGRTVLHQACIHKVTNALKLLVASGADINTTDIDGSTALHLAVLSKRLSSVKFLIEHGSCINSVDNGNETPLSQSIRSGQFDAAILLINSGADLDLDVYNTVLRRAIRAGAPVSVIECLLEHGANVTTIYRNTTALTSVLSSSKYSRNRKLQIAKLLLIYGANHYLENRLGDTLLHWACKKGHVELVKYLIDYGLDVDAENIEGKKPCDIARENGHTNIVKVIIHYHCNKYMKF